jgi:nucleoside 2-deoxyribosyltransferase
MTTGKPTVYLAGPIVGCDFDQANTWRWGVASALADHNILGISPLRCEPMIGDRYEAGYMCPKFGTAKAIGSKNRFDVRQCDMTLAFIPEPKGDLDWPSIGTICELSWAFADGKQTILVSDSQRIREHPVLNATAGWVLEDLDSAIDVIVGVLGGYATGGKNI